MTKNSLLSLHASFRSQVMKCGFECHFNNEQYVCLFSIPALPICTSTTKTGNTIFIDTSKVPPNEAIKCNCSVDINASAQSVHVGYELSVATWPDATSCGLRFQTGTIGFKCNDNPLVELTKSFNQLQFSKDTSDVDACFILFIGKFLSFFSLRSFELTTNKTPAKYEERLVKSIFEPMNATTTTKLTLDSCHAL